MADWRELLKFALPALDEAFGKAGPGTDVAWTLGGGAAISLVNEFRHTHDVDIFLQRGRRKALTPDRNAAARAISETEPGATIHRLLGRDIAVETPEEVIVKKMRYRTATFTARDVFDLAAVSTIRPDLAAVLAEEVPDSLARVREGVRLHAERGIDALARSIDPTPSGVALLPHVFELANAVLDKAQAAVRQRESRDEQAEQAHAPLRSVARGPRKADDIPAVDPRRDCDRGR